MARAPLMPYRSGMDTLTARPTITIGDLLRDWRQRRRLSQLALATEADVSARHLSFLETGRAKPSREMLLRLADHLQIPLRERNALLVAGGFAPVYPERGLEDPAMSEARKAVDLILSGHEPYPALAIDRHWTLVAANRALPILLQGVDPDLLTPPVNVLRVAIHPNGLAPRTVNLAQWRGHILGRLRLQVESSADPVLAGLLEELSDYPLTDGEAATAPEAAITPGVVIPLRLRTDEGILSFFSTTTVFGTPIDITLAELAIESFYPANQWTADQLRRFAQNQSG
jgi:transcriptional regulator with XRE-family HTH domain